MTCRVQVRIHGHLGQCGSIPGLLVLPDDSTFDHLLSLMGLRPGDVGPVFQNGTLAVSHSAITLTDGDVFDLYPVAGGGV